jgi:hypothetical protein
MLQAGPVGEYLLPPSPELPADAPLSQRPPPERSHFHVTSRLRLLRVPVSRILGLREHTMSRELIWRWHRTEDDAEFACKIMNQIKLYGKPIRVNKVRPSAPRAMGYVADSVVHVQASSDRKQIDIGANLFVGNLDPNVDERMVFDTFMSFGTLVQPAKVRSPFGPSQLILLTPGFPDFSRSSQWSLQGLRIHLLRLLRSVGRGYRVDELSIPHEQTRDSRLRIQEGREGRTTRYARRATPRCPSAQEQRSPSLGTHGRSDPPSSADVSDGTTRVWDAGDASTSSDGVPDGREQLRRSHPGSSAPSTGLWWVWRPTTAADDDAATAAAVWRDTSSSSPRFLLSERRSCTDPL